MLILVTVIGTMPIGSRRLGFSHEHGQGAPFESCGMGSRSRRGMAGAGISGPTRSDRSGRRSELGRPNAGNMTQATAAIRHLEVS
jgi:hypothetical protein